MAGNGFTAVCAGAEATFHAPFAASCLLHSFQVLTQVSRPQNGPLQLSQVHPPTPSWPSLVFLIALHLFSIYLAQWCGCFCSPLPLLCNFCVYHVLSLQLLAKGLVQNGYSLSTWWMPDWMFFLGFWCPVVAAALGILNQGSTRNTLISKDLFFLEATLSPSPPAMTSRWSLATGRPLALTR